MRDAVLVLMEAAVADGSLDGASLDMRAGEDVASCLARVGVSGEYTDMVFALYLAKHMEAPLLIIAKDSARQVFYEQLLNQEAHEESHVIPVYFNGCCDAGGHYQLINEQWLQSLDLGYDLRFEVVAEKADSLAKVGGTTKIRWTCNVDRTINVMFRLTIFHFGVYYRLGVLFGSLIRFRCTSLHSLSCATGHRRIGSSHRCV
jgi:hypothetical protein